MFRSRSHIKESNRPTRATQAGLVLVGSGGGLTIGFLTGLATGAYPLALSAGLVLGLLAALVLSD